MDVPATFFMTGGPDAAHPECRYPLIPTLYPFDRAILSPNGTIADDGNVDCFAGDPERPLHHLVSWSGTETTTDDQKPLAHPVNVDVLELEGPSRTLAVAARMSHKIVGRPPTSRGARWRGPTAHWSGFSPASSAGSEPDPRKPAVVAGRGPGDNPTAVTRLGVTLYDSHTIRDVGRSFRVGALHPPTELPVEFISQFACESPDNGSLCCPTSAAMVLGFWEKDVNALEFARRSYDRRHRLYGNWSLTAAAMSSFGMMAWVQKHDAVSELQETVRAGRPVIVSISFAEGELAGSPLPRTSGHLLVVRGFAENGDVLVCDPAGRTSSAGRRAYDRRAFARAWLGHGGIAIHAMPEELVS